MTAVFNLFVSFILLLVQLFLLVFQFAYVNKFKTVDPLGYNQKMMFVAALWVAVGVYQVFNEIAIQHFSRPTLTVAFAFLVIGQIVAYYGYKARVAHFEDKSTKL